MAHSYITEIERKKKPITVDELAGIIRVDRKAVYEWANRVRDPLPRMPLGGIRKILFDPATLAFYFRRQDPIAAAALNHTPSGHQ